MIRKIAIFAILLVSACASQIQPMASQGWKISKEIGLFNFKPRVIGVEKSINGIPMLPTEFHILYLTDLGNGAWMATIKGDASKVGTEVIWLDSQHKTLGLAATGTSLQTNLKSASVCGKVVDYDREKAGYLACNSNLVSRVKDLGLILAPLNAVMALTGDRIIAFEADTTKIAQALADVDLDGFARQLDAEFAEEQRYAKEQLAEQNQAREQYILQFQHNAGVGTRTLCGLVIGIRGNIVEVQSNLNKGQTAWLERSQITPPVAMPISSVLSHCAKLF